MEHTDQLKNKKYRNWVRAGLGIKYVKEGLGPFCDHLVTQQHIAILGKVKKKHNLPALSCGHCDVGTLQPDHVQTKSRQCPLGQTHCNCLHPRGKTSCPSNICGAIYDEIISRHASTPPAPYWRNTDAHQWCTEPWAVAKCFINAPGYEHKIRAVEFDCSGFLHLLINNIEFHQHILCGISGNDAISRVLQHRNAIFHSNNMELEDTDIANYVDDMIELLQDDKEIKGRQESKEAVKKLLELKQEQFIITTTDETEVRRIAMAAIEDKEKYLEQKIVDATNEIGVKTSESEKQIKATGLTVKDELAQKGIDLKDDLRKTEIYLKGKLEQKEKEIKEAMRMREVESTEKMDQKEIESKEHLRMTEVALKQKLKKKELKIKENLTVTEVNTKQRFKHEEIVIRQSLRETERRLDQKEKEIEQHLERKGQNILYQLERKQSAHIHFEAMEAADDLMRSGLHDTPVQSNYERIGAELKDDLATFYTERYSTIPLSPLFEEHVTPLVDFYILPEMNFIERPKNMSDMVETKTPVKSFSDIFRSENSCEIYLTANAGFGKTAFSKYLALAWCQAYRPEEKYKMYYQEDVINAMHGFEFLFLVLLRDSSDECSIDDLIVKQIVENLSRYSAVTIDFLQEILHRERCLVILDGLDEWTHPDKKCAKVPKTIPHRNARKKCVILTTTRPWKLGVLNLKTSEIDKKVELVKLTSKSAQTLQERAISKIKDLDVPEARNLAKQLNKKIKENKLEDLESVPLLTMYLICLWCDDIPLGQSKCGLYASIVELLLSRTISKHPEMNLTCEPSKIDIPKCLNEHENCTKYYTCLKALGQLAFETLFSETKECTLVFNKSVADKFLTPDYFKLNLRSGVLTQSTEKKLTKQSSKVSFSHKTMQEFFCALYISCQNESDVKKFFLKNCKSLQNILDLSTVFVFISGMMNTEIISSLSREFMPVISEDKITSKYRSTTCKYCEPLKDIQDMYISCIEENTDDLKICCQDFFFHEDCKENKYFTHLTRLAVHNKNQMESININTESYPGLSKIIEHCALNHSFNINKIYYRGMSNICHLSGLLNRLTKCVCVVSSVSCTREISEILQKNSLLQAINIKNFWMSHDVLNDFLNYIVNRKTMREIMLNHLPCKEHYDSCTFSLDFCQHSDLRMLELSWLPKMSQLKVNSQVKHVVLQDINLGEMLLPPGIVDIEYVEFTRVNMSASTFRGLVKVLEKSCHKVKVQIRDCKIGPETEFEDVKQYIRSSQNFWVMGDYRRHFAFERDVDSEVSD